MKSIALPLLVAATLLPTTARPAAAQTHVAPGAIVGAKEAEFRVMAANGLDSKAFTPPSPVTSVLWDPKNPDQFICGGGSIFAGGGYLLRATFTSASNVTWTQLTPAGTIGQPVQLTWDQNGKDLVVVTMQNQVHRIDAVTGAISDVTSGVQPWGNQVNCGAVDPLNGDLYVGTGGGQLWRLPAGGGAATLFLSGLGNLQDLLIDSKALPHHLYALSSNALHRIDLSQPPVAVSVFGGFGQPASSGWADIEYDLHGDLVLVRSSDDGVYKLPHVATIPNEGIAPIYLGQFAGSIFEDLHNVSIVGSTSQPFRLTFESAPVLGAKLALENVPQPLGPGWIFVSRSAFLEKGSGPFFGIVPDALTLTVLGMPATPGGILAFFAVPPPTIVAPTGTMLPFYGETWDAVAVAFAPGGKLIGRSNVARTTWQ